MAMTQCLNCGRWHNYEGDYCSQKCIDEATAKRCDWCGGLVLHWPPYIHGTKCYCSAKCRMEATAGFRSNNTSNYTPPPPQIVYTTFPDDAWNEYQKGIGFHNNSSYNDALNSYTKAINMGCHHPDTYGFRGNVYNSLSKYQSAISDFNKAIELLKDGNNYYEAKEDLLWISSRGIAYAQIADYKHALEDFDYFDDNARGDWEYAKMYYYHGFVYWKLGDKKKAKMLFENAVNNEPNNELYKAALKGKVPESLEPLMHDSLESQGDEAYAQDEGFQGAAAQGDEDYGEFDYYEMPDKALKEFHKATKFFNDNEYAKAVEAYTKTIQLNGIDPDVYGRRGQSYMLQWDNKSAIADLTKALELYNSNVNYSVEMGADELHYLRGKAYMDMDDLKSVNEKDANDLKHAIEDFSEIIKIHNKDEDDCFDDTEKAEPYFYRGSIYLKMGDKKKAVADLKRAVLLAPNKEMYTTALKDAEGK